MTKNLAGAGDSNTSTAAIIGVVILFGNDRRPLANSARWAQVDILKEI
jgi:hypothetical protein